MYHELQNSCYEKEIHLLSFLSHFVSFKRNNYYHLKMYQYKLKKNNKNSSKLKFILKYHEKLKLKMLFKEIKINSNFDIVFSFISFHLY